MIIYNVTMSIENSIKENWLKWMEKEHVPEILRSGCFKKATIYKVLGSNDTDSTFAVAYVCNTIQELHSYQANFANKLQEKHYSVFGDKAVAFRTFMEVVKEF